MKCSACDKELIGIPDTGSRFPRVCGSCSLVPSTQFKADEEEQFAELENTEENRKSVSMDLSYLRDRTLDRAKKGLSNSKHSAAVFYNIQQLARTAPALGLETRDEVKRIKIKSNSVRSKSYLIDTLALHFDTDGFASIPESELARVQEHMRSRPGRFKIVVEAPAPGPLAELAAAKAELAAAEAELTAAKAESDAADAEIALVAAELALEHAASVEDLPAVEVPDLEEVESVLEEIPQKAVRGRGRPRKVTKEEEN
jgi:hypothetical protein